MKRALILFSVVIGLASTSFFNAPQAKAGLLIPLGCYPTEFACALAAGAGYFYVYDHNNGACWRGVP